jgi:hypothetical protein
MCTFRQYRTMSAPRLRLWRRPVPRHAHPRLSGRPGWVDWAEARDNGVEWCHEIKQIIDYHVVLEPGASCRPDDTALLDFALRCR